MDAEVPSLLGEHTIFSLREDRVVKYEIMAQTLVDSTWQMFRTDQVTQTFQLCKSACRSQVRFALSSTPFWGSLASHLPCPMGELCSVA